MADDPVQRIATDPLEAGPEAGIALCLSGGSYRAIPQLPCPQDRTTALAQIATRLKRLDDDLQERLINWGYAVCDAALRTHVDPQIAQPAGLPYPAAGV